MDAIADGQPAYAAAVRALAALRQPLRIVVVGANDGRLNDPVYPVLHDGLADATEVLLIEPQADLHPVLRDNFAFHPAAHFVQAAVGRGGTLVLHGVDPTLWPHLVVPYATGWPAWRAPTGIVSGLRQTVVDWTAEHAPPGTDVQAAVQRMEVPCLPLRDILAQASWPDVIDVLQIDAEGCEADVIAACDLAVTRPAVIWVETCNLALDSRAALYAALTHGYHLQPFARDLLAVRKPD